MFSLYYIILNHIHLSTLYGALRHSIKPEDQCILALRSTNAV